MTMFLPITIFPPGFRERTNIAALLLFAAALMTAGLPDRTSIHKSMYGVYSNKIIKSNYIFNVSNTNRRALILYEKLS